MHTLRLRMKLRWYFRFLNAPTTTTSTIFAALPSNKFLSSYSPWALHSYNHKVNPKSSTASVFEAGKKMCAVTLLKLGWTEVREMTTTTATMLTTITIMFVNNVATNNNKNSGNNNNNKNKNNRQPKRNLMSESISMMMMMSKWKECNVGYRLMPNLLKSGTAVSGERDKKEIERGRESVIEIVMCATSSKYRTFATHLSYCAQG